MAATPRIPRFTVPGWAAFNATAEVWAKWLEWCLRPTGVHPLIVERGASGPVFRLAATSDDLTYIALTSVAAPDGGYPWASYTEAPPVQVTAPGSGYTAATATASGGGWTGWTLAVTVDAAAGTVTAVTFTGSAGVAGTPNGLPTVTISGDGSGATAAVTDPQAGTPSRWVATGTTGDIKDAAYEARGCYTVPFDGTIYPAWRGPNGKLLFFCNPVLAGYTVDNGSYPTTTGVYYAVQPVTVTGDQSEGGLGVLTDSPGSLVFAHCLGTVAPTVGSYVLLRWTGIRWVFRYDVGQGPLSVTAAAGLHVNVAAGGWVDSGGTTVAAYAGVTSFALSASVTTYLYLSGGSLTTSTSGFPGSGHYVPIAVVVTGASVVTSVTDRRNFSVVAKET